MDSKSDKYDKGGLHVFQLRTGIAIVSDDHVYDIPISGPGDQVKFVADGEREETIDYFEQLAGGLMIGKNGGHKP